ncbi:MAG: nicotinic acid mononucleotide adenyltransferase [Flavobacteriaceae bacterium]|nr:nicotinic acid mononucleotide adenyltransferase [Flavobacteriaceae bacterium]
MKAFFLMIGLLFMHQLAVGQQMTTEVKDTFIQEGDKIIAVLYHDNGKIAQQGQYTLDNKLDGKWVSYDVDGQITAIAQYDKGEKVGTWVFFDGITKREVTYKDSRIAKVNTWEMKASRVVSNR